MLMTDLYRHARHTSEDSYGWLVAACQLGLDCTAEDALMQTMCGPFSTTCGIHESVSDMLLRTIGQHGLDIANQKAEKIVDAVSRSRIDELQIYDALIN